MVRRLSFCLLILFAVSASLNAQNTASYKRGEWRSQDVPEGYFAKSFGRYQFQSNAPVETVEKIARHMNAMFKLYSKHFPSAKTPKFNLVIKVFQDRKFYLEYGAPPSSGGYYSPTDKEMVGYDTGMVGGVAKDDAKKTTGDEEAANTIFKKKRRRATIDTIGVFSHEGWHQYFHWSCGSQVPFPAWADEGIGEYYYPSYMRGDSLMVGAPNDYRLATIQAAIEKKRFVPLTEFVRYEQAQYYANADICYAEGWAFVHFLFEHPSYAPKQYVQKFVQVFKDQHSIAKTMDIVFKGVDWETLEKDWIEWTMALTPIADEDDTRDETEKKVARAATARNALLPEVKKAVLLILERRRQ